MFKVKVRNYWWDYCQETDELKFPSLDSMWAHFVRLWQGREYKTSLKPQGIIKDGDKERGYIELSSVLPMKCGRYGTLMIEEIECDGVIIYDRHYTSPKLLAYMREHDITKMAERPYGDF